MFFKTPTTSKLLKVYLSMYLNPTIIYVRTSSTILISSCFEERVRNNRKDGLKKH